jgi:hypothetical protein
MHLKIETGIIFAARTVVAKAEPALSSVGEALANQGAAVTGTTTASPTLSRQRAFTVGGEYSANLLFDADSVGAFTEMGVVGKGHFDTFLGNERFFEEDGLTYVRVPTRIGAEAGYFRGEAGFRVRVSQFEEQDVDAALGIAKGRNAADLLLIEGLYQRSGALKGLVRDGSGENRWLMRFMATPYINPKNPDSVKRTKFVLGIEVNDDFGDGMKDIRLFYGANMNLTALF